MEDDLNLILLEKMIVSKLLTQTIDLIHSTKVIKAIKKLTQAYDILILNQEIIAKYSEKDKFCWDKAAVQDLNHISRELVVYHRIDFKPVSLVYNYNDSVTHLVDSLYANDRIYNQ